MTTPNQQTDPQSLENSNSTNPPAPVDSPSPPTPPTNQPTAPVIDSSYVALLQESLRESNRQLAESNQRLVQVASERANPPEPIKSVDELRTEFLNDPTNATRNIIREELRATVAPLLEDFSRN